MAKQHQMLDKTTTHFYAHHSCWCWFNLRMYYTTKLFSVIALILIAKNRTTADSVTLVLLLNWTQDMGWLMHFFGCINWMMRTFTRAQRVFNLQDIPQEITEGTKPSETDVNWPSKGEINFDKIKLRYRPNTDIVLNELDFKVEAGHKIGVCGRTGAGKSTLAMAMTRIVELEEGKIEIDGLDIAKMPLKDLRDAITMIPQEPTLFSGTLRYNLDPFDEASDERVLELINKAGLDYLMEGTSKKEQEDKKKSEEEEKKKKEKLGSLAQLMEESDEESSDKKDDKSSDKKKDDDAKGVEKRDDDKENKDEDKEKKDEEEDGKGLKFKVQEEGKNLSVGERQLICIIRAILRSNKLVILDEATANIDVVTE